MAPLPLRGSLSLVPETAAAMRSCRGRDRVGCCAAAIETPTWAGPQALDLDFRDGKHAASCPSNMARPCSTWFNASPSCPLRFSFSHCLQVGMAPLIPPPYLFACLSIFDRVPHTRASPHRSR